jgi:5'-AMP-activated protein kinase, regulatory beta subunit
VVEIQGSFDNWSSKTALQKSGADFTILKLLPPGVYQVRDHCCLGPAVPGVFTNVTTLQYKYIVDGNWTYDPNLPAMYDDLGNINNLIEVHEYVPENLDSLSGFEPPPSPDSR